MTEWLPQGICNYFNSHFHYLPFFFLFWWYWGLNSEPHAFYVGAVPLEPLLQSPRHFHYL
jgi:hypothetical protein